MNDTLAQPVGEKPKLPKLTMHDRCDSQGVTNVGFLNKKHAETYPSCQERAYVLVMFKTGFDLVFCKHHYEQQEIALMQAGAVVVDDNRADLEVKPGVSAAS